MAVTQAFQETQLLHFYYLNLVKLCFYFFYNAVNATIIA